MKKILLSTVLSTLSLFAYDVGINTSYDYLNVNQTNSQNMILGEKPKNHGFGIEAYYSGQCLLTDNETIKNYVSIKHTDMSNTNKYELFAGINKEYPLNEEFTLYSGALIGYGFLKYDYNPLGSTDVVDESAGSFLYGVQLGTKYKIKEFDNLFLKVEARYIRSDYDANLEAAGVYSRLTHRDASSISIGLGYSF
ncbi:MAG: hypothetical protein CL624_13080 [Arcobacter sp.]|nr:hypothetical protein [Arcobacter sp.]|tara:strand:- start:11682 stop:12266 length:585 start_codon:yes stop_codon:yes gene_type:complete